MKTYKLFISAIVGSLLFTSCEGFLDTPPRSQQTLDQYYQNEKEAEKGVNGIYSWIGNKFGSIAYGECPAFMLEYPTGHARFSEGQQSLINPDLEKLIYWNRGYVDNWWQISYYAIEASNIAIDGLNQLPQTENIISLKGEAYFHRAFHYFNLVRIFGDIPIKLTKTQRPADGVLKKSSIQEVYEQAILPSLEEAEKNNIVNSPSSGKISKQAIYALKAQVYLTMAGYPLNQTDKYALAAENADKVIKSGLFSLFQSDVNATWYEKLRSKEFDNQGEYILMANYGRNPSPQQYYSIQFLTAVTDRIIGVRGFGSLMPVASFVASYDANDTRAKEKGFFFSTYPDYEDPQKTLNFETSIYKFFDPSMPQFGGGYSDKSLPLIRYAEILLTYAEAQAQSGGVNSEAVDAVNKIRTRAGLSELGSDITSSKEKFVDEVIKQRALELCYEGVTFFDMVRTQKAWDAKTKTLRALEGYMLPSGAVFSVEQHSHFPIPLREIQINPELK